MKLEKIPPKQHVSSAPSTNNVANNSFTTIHELPSEEWKNLCGALGLTSFHFALTVLPNWILQRRLERRVEIISKDDKDLIREGVKDLTMQESRDACLMRGLTATDVRPEASQLVSKDVSQGESILTSDDETAPYKQALSLWLASPVSVSLRSGGKPTTVAAIYALARPEIYLDGYKPVSHS
jgi:hypothetical protein